MKVIQSFWSKAYLNEIKATDSKASESLGFLTDQLFFATRALSVLNLRKHFDEVVLVTDDYGKRLLVDYLQLPYTKVVTALNDIDSYDIELPSISKVYACSIQEEPFLHFDGDVFIWDKPGQSVLDAPLVCQHVERPQGVFVEYLKRSFNNLNDVPEEVFPYQENVDELGIASTGVFGGNDVGFFKQYTKAAFELVDKNPKYRYQVDIKMFNMIFERYLFSCLAKSQNIEVAKWIDYPVSDDYCELVNFCGVPNKTTYIQLSAAYKKQITNMEQVLLRLKYEHPKYFKFFKSLFGNKVFDLGVNNRVLNLTA